MAGGILHAVRIVHAHADPRCDPVPPACLDRFGEPVDARLGKIEVEVVEADHIVEIGVELVRGDVGRPGVRAEEVAIPAPVTIDHRFEPAARIPRHLRIGVRKKGVDAGVGQ
jgi:hypothetical protein